MLVIAQTPTWFLMLTLLSCLMLGSGHDNVMDPSYPQQPLVPSFQATCSRHPTLHRPTGYPHPW
ncbi:hypothetical protein CC77DRAFT_1017287 [Alternaria alternata]|uniref:Uncharacterized protein n=1 Tax=Alternaria alternata TaxID=5599 RepID=A0A177DVH6_ALTAL|nr:hypothetical protein CC77DRAFT_1017287 [Alternaria alternata]OAG23627.1 hypothetical protein CC77DRAFT_1017287 [Alternaria alternata]